KAICDSTGYDELSLISLSTSDHPEIEPLMDRLLDWTEKEKINLSLPSLRIDTLSSELVEKIARVRKSGLTFAPEAGTQRLRDVINKNIDEAEIMHGCAAAFEAGYTSVKLYFMMGLPTETDEDIIGIAELARRIVDLYYSMPNKPRGKSVNVSVSCACFIPKPFTPFQFFPQDTIEEFNRKQKLLRDTVSTKKISISWHDASTSLVEAVLARGDRRLGKAILEVYNNGGIFDSWNEGFSFERWMDAFKSLEIDPLFYANRARSFEEINPWDFLDYGIDKKFLIKEYKKATKQQITTPKCSEKCSNCGIVKFTGRKCFD
ncbi:MAG: TIGR03960 family B12-binding radical SAM protein, partial [Oscillospiraceae bacterium]